MQNEQLLVLEERIMVIDERWIRMQRTTYTVENNQSSTLLISIGLQYFIIYFIRFHLISSWGRSVVANREPVAKEDSLVYSAGIPSEEAQHKDVCSPVCRSSVSD